MDQRIINTIINESAIIIGLHLLKLYYCQNEYSRYESWIGSILNNWKYLNDSVSLSDYDNINDKNVSHIYDKIIKEFCKENSAFINSRINISLLSNYFGNIINYSDMDHIEGFINDVIGNNDISNLFHIKYLKCRKPKKFIIKKNKY